MVFLFLGGLMPKVYNRHHKDAPPGAIYIGRGTLWGNPYSHIYAKDVIMVGSREQSIDFFIESVNANPAFRKQVKDMLKGKDLLCSCAPLACHGDVLLEIANGGE